MGAGEAGRGRGRPLRVSFPVQITKKQCCWSGALRLGFTSKDPSRIHPDSLPKYACPDLVSQSGFWAKALPEEFANEGNIIAFWVDKKGRVFYRINDSAAMLFFNGVRTADPLWALVDVYGLTRGVQLLGECPLPVPPRCWGSSGMWSSPPMVGPQGHVGMGTAQGAFLCPAELTHPSCPQLGQEAPGWDSCPPGPLRLCL